MVMLWLDDNRPAPDGWAWCQSVNDAIRFVTTATEPITHMSLDHDLGDYFGDGGDGARFTDWLADPNNAGWPSDGIRIHSRSSVGRPTMLATIDTYSDFPIGYQDSRGTAPEGGWPIVLL